MARKSVPDISKMSIREKVEQTMVVYISKKEKLDFTAGGAFFGGEIITAADEEGVEKLRAYVDKFSDECNIPPLITSDFEYGCGSMIKGLTPFPFLMGLGATQDAELAYDYGKATAIEARSVGANWSFSPVCDLNKNHRNPLVSIRSMTDDEELASKMIPQIVCGMQNYGLAACAKHFPGDGMDYRDQHITTTKNSLTMGEWRSSFGKVYKSLINAGLYSVMAGHITLPDYPQELSERYGLPLPGTLNKELINNLLKGELGFDGVVVTDALQMGGFQGWYDTKEIAEIESFKAGCDMMLWPSKTYADNLERAVLSGEVPMERLDDAVTRILCMKEKLGLFDENFKRFYDLTEADHEFIKGVQQRCVNQSITLVRDRQKHFPLSLEKIKQIGIITLTEYDAVKEDAAVLKEEFEMRGFSVLYDDAGIDFDDDKREAFYEKCDLVIYAMYSRPFRPIGFIDYTQGRAWQIGKAFMPPYAMDKTVFVSFGSPYMGNQYLEKASTYVNAYAPLECSVRGFARAACGEIEFQGVSPVKL